MSPYKDPERQRREPMTERERALANARTAWSIESWRPDYFAWKELALELAAYVIAGETPDDEVARQAPTSEPRGG